MNYLVAAAIPHFQSSTNPELHDITDSAVTVIWREPDNIPSGLEHHYMYRMWVQADGEAEKMMEPVKKNKDKGWVESRITDLRFNTNYSVRVKPYRQHNGEQDGGNFTGVTKFKTRCTGSKMYFSPLKIAFDSKYCTIHTSSTSTRGILYLDSCLHCLCHYVVHIHSKRFLPTLLRWNFSKQRNINYNNDNNK